MRYSKGQEEDSLSASVEIKHDFCCVVCDDQVTFFNPVIERVPRLQRQKKVFSKQQGDGEEPDREYKQSKKRNVTNCFESEHHLAADNEYRPVRTEWTKRFFMNVKIWEGVAFGNVLRSEK